MRLVYMNHMLKDKANLRRKIPEPVIALQSDATLTYANKVEILDSQGSVVATVTWDKKGNPHTPHHRVLAWIEVGDGANLRVS